MDSKKIIFNKKKSGEETSVGDFELSDSTKKIQCKFCQKIFVGLIFIKKKLKNSFFKNKEQNRNQRLIDLDKKLVFSLAKGRVPSFRQLKYLKRFLSNKEKWSLIISMVIIFVSLSCLGINFYFKHLQTVPIAGGEYTEGLIGSPQYINPLYVGFNDVDNDLSQLIFSSLFRRGSNGELIKDLVESYEIIDDKTYIFTIKKNIYWHDGSDLTVDDIIFTFNALKDIEYKSPWHTSFSGVDIKKEANNKVKFILSEPYAAFLELLTFGILPGDIWSQIPPSAATLAELNLKPIGSGQYKFKELIKDKNGIIKEYALAVNDKYYGDRPYVDLRFKLFGDFTTAIVALNNNEIDGLSYLPLAYKKEVLKPKTLNFYKLYLPQSTLIFLNQEKNKALADKALRQALAYSLDRNSIINNVLGGDAYIVDGPILPNSFAYFQDINKYEYNPKKAKELLDSIDWKLVEITEEEIKEANEKINQNSEEKITEEEKTQIKELITMGAGKWRKKNNNFLIINLTSVERDENEAVIAQIKDYWEAIGIKVATNVLPAVNIQKEIIKPRNFEALFYGQVAGADPDPYAFWHSSQTGENGFNIANFANKEVDQILEDARLVSDVDKRQEYYKKFQEIIAEELPVLFMYSPIYTYVQANSIKGFDVKSILVPRDRFSNISDWYIKTGKKLIFN